MEEPSRCSPNRRLGELLSISETEGADCGAVGGGVIGGKWWVVGDR